MKQGTQITSQRADEFGIQGQQEGESDSAFRDRVSGTLSKPMRLTRMRCTMTLKEML